MPGFGLTPRSVPRVETAFRRIVTDIPVPESLPLFEKLHRYEPVAFHGQPPVVWDHGDRFQVCDPWGNCWIDWSSGVLITNAGHGRQEIVDAIVRQATSKLLTTFAFTSEIKVRLLEKVASLFPEPMKKVFLFSTGSEAVETAIKFCRTHGIHKGGRDKHVFVSFQHAFHGRTLGAQQAGGIPALKEWIVNLDPGFVQAPFPDGYLHEDTSFEGFPRFLADTGVEPRNVCGVMLETYQGGSACFAPPDYIQALRRWCDEHGALLVFDEVQASFGRTGRLMAYEHYGVQPDLCTLGKGFSGSLPQSALVGPAEVLDLHPPLSMTNTHAGSPVPCAATLASIELVLGENLTENSLRLGEILHARLQKMKEKSRYIGHVAGKGLVAGVACVKPGTKEPDAELAFDTVRRLMEKGVLLFAPVGFGLGTVKICPPLVITEDALLDSLEAFEEAFNEATAHKEAVPA